MNDEDIIRRIQEVVRDQLDDETITLNRATRADEVEDWDSLAHVRIMIGVEEEFGVRFQTSEITSLKNIGGLVDLIRARL
ncbi:acyl carrier protein [Sphingomonas sp.]|jgi:acyl carrier protein|uniref:acyl carrier protein n=1 Tax=Sphingomonas sp. TaxID=28214 RepID=UPI002E312EEC|nr:acyl carrier protein [Sphingomonas sp.]HEX4695898.1 acyl carrier protein [Sphingomonas sp.]